MGEQLLLSHNIQKKSRTGHLLEAWQGVVNCSDETSVLSSSHEHAAQIKVKIAFCIFSLCSFVFLLVLSCTLANFWVWVKAGSRAQQCLTFCWFLKKYIVSQTVEASHYILSNNQVMFLSPPTRYECQGKGPHFIHLWIPHPSTVPGTQ